MEGLRPGKGYLFRVRASNAKGQGPWSSIAGAETQAAPPEAPSAPAISQRTSTSARCKWDVPVEDHGAAVLRYRSPSLPHPQGSPAAQMPVLRRACLLTQASSMTLSWQLLFRSHQVSTMKAACCGLSAISVTASWLVGSPHPGSEQEKDACRLEVAEEGREWVEAWRGLGTSAKIGGLTPGRPHQVRVAASNAVGEGALSRAAAFSTLLLAPPGAPAPAG